MIFKKLFKFLEEKQPLIMRNGTFYFGVYLNIFFFFVMFERFFGNIFRFFSMARITRLCLRFENLTGHFFFFFLVFTDLARNHYDLCSAQR